MMKKKISLLHGTGRKLHWGVLVHDTAYKKIQKLDNLMSMLLDQVQFAEVVTVSTLEREPGKDKSNQTL